MLFAFAPYSTTAWRCCPTCTTTRWSGICIGASPLCSFEAQVEAAESLYGVQLELYIQNADITAALADMETLYPRPVLERAERLVREQLRRYAAYRK